MLLVFQKQFRQTFVEKSEYEYSYFVLINNLLYEPDNNFVFSMLFGCFQDVEMMSKMEVQCGFCRSVRV